MDRRTSRDRRRADRPNATGRRDPRLRRSRPRAGRTCPWLILAAVLWSVPCLPGCGLEAPQRPSFETTLQVPFAAQSYTGEDLAQSLEAVHADSAQPSPLTLRVREPIDPFHVDGRLRAELGAQAREVAIDRLAFDPPRIEPVSFSAPALLPDGPWLGGGSEALVIAPFTFEPAPAQLGPFASYEEIALLGGELELTITNALPIAVGGAAGLRVTILDLGTSPPREVAGWQTTDLVGAGETRTVRCSLAGVVLGNALALALAGGSPGSEGELVTLSGEETLGIALRFRDLSLRSILGDLPATTYSARIRVPLPGTVRIASADIRSGEITWDLHNGLPTDIELLVSSAGILEDGQVLRRSLRLPASGNLVHTLDLAGTRLVGEAAGAGVGHCVWDVTVRVPEGRCPSPLEVGQAVRASSRAGELCFDRVQGVFDAYQVRLDPVAVAIEYPEGTGEIEFVAAELSLLLRNRLGVSGEADLWVQGAGGPAPGPDSSATDRLSLTVAIAPGRAGLPAESRVAVSELDSALLEVLAARPDSLRLGGTLRLGDGEALAQVEAGDYVDGCIEMIAPLRLRLGVARHQGDPFDVDLEEDVRRRIDESLENLMVDAQVENHFPTGVRIRMHFARSEGALFVNDDLLFEGDMVVPATVDAASGRVTAAARNRVRLSLCQGDIGLFATEQLCGAMEVELTGVGDRPVEIWSTDYVTIRGVVAFDCRWE